MTTAWIASYPKSGNTWVRFLLYSAIYGPPERSVDVSRRITDIHRPTDTLPPAQGPELIKTHFPLSDEHPRIDESVAAIHVIRNPRDVLLSALHYHKMTKRRILGISDKRFASRFIAHGGHTEWIKPFGTWAAHTRSWQRTDRFPVLTVRYEDLKADPCAQLDRIIGFLGLEVDNDARARAVEASTFDRMRDLEVNEKSQNPAADQAGRPFVGTSHATKKGRFFINKGATNQRLDQIAQGLDGRFDHAFADALDAYGYAPSSSALAAKPQ